MIYYKKLTTEDYDDILDISKDIWGGTDYLPALFHKWVDAPGFFVGAVDGDSDKVVGVGKYSILHDGSGWLEGLRVHKNYRGLKIGKNISNYLLNIAKEELSKGKIKTIAFSTHGSNDESIGIMKKLGFQLTHQYTIVSKDFNSLDKALSLNKLTVNPWDISFDEFIELSYWKKRNNIVPLSFVFENPTRGLYEDLKNNDSFICINGFKGIIKIKGEVNFIALDDNFDAIDTFMNYALLKYHGDAEVMTSVLPDDIDLMSKLQSNKFLSWFNWKPDYLMFEYK